MGFKWGVVVFGFVGVIMAMEGDHLNFTRELADFYGVTEGPVRMWLSPDQFQDCVACVKKGKTKIRSVILGVDN